MRDKLVVRTADLEEQTRDKADNLEQRLKSWQVNKHVLIFTDHE